MVNGEARERYSCAGESPTTSHQEGEDGACVLLFFVACLSTFVCVCVLLLWFFFVCVFVCVCVTLTAGCKVEAVVGTMTCLSS